MKNQMKAGVQIIGIAFALVIAAAMALPVAAQEATEPAVTTTAQVDVADEDEGFNDWGILGLAGLAGLAGLLRRQDRPAVIDPTRTATRASER